jgi:nitrite reductase/ring-hydroxylating ferredoxin subunit
MAFVLYVSLLALALYLIGLAIRQALFLRDKKRSERRSRFGAFPVARIEELEPGAVRKFQIICGRYRVDCFLIRYDGEFYAYVNRCRHMTTPLDFVRNQFFTDDRRYLVCMTHGALYEPRSGLCVEGPCKGAALYRLPVTIDRGEVLVGCPEGDLAFLAD